jgi:hypothetical protein
MMPPGGLDSRYHGGKAAFSTENQGFQPIANRVKFLPGVLFVCFLEKVVDGSGNRPYPLRVTNSKPP